MLQKYKEEAYMGLPDGIEIMICNQDFFKSQAPPRAAVGFLVPKSASLFKTTEMIYHFFQQGFKQITLPNDLVSFTSHFPNKFSLSRDLGASKFEPAARNKLLRSLPLAEVERLPGIEILTSDSITYYVPLNSEPFALE